MARRKRLAPPSPFAQPGPETGTAPLPRAAGLSPIASVAGETSAAAALSELAEAMESARRGGRMVIELPLDAVEADYLVRDRIVADEDEMRALMESLAARGQQTPIDVTDLGGGRYGLISGWRRLEALRRLGEAGRAPGTGQVLALLRRPDDAPDAYVAMIEENEIRVGLSYYERARIAARAAEAGVFASEREALKALFENASPAKLSKIGSFQTIVRNLDGALRFPGALGERLGLTLARALEADPAFGEGLRAELQARPAASPDEEATRIRDALDRQAVPEAPAKIPKAPARRKRSVDSPELVSIEWLGDGCLRLSGPGVSEAFHADLERWLARRR